jgi:hypothetical protein
MHLSPRTTQPRDNNVELRSCEQSYWVYLQVLSGAKVLSRGRRVDDVEECWDEKGCEGRRAFGERLKQDSQTTGSGHTLYINEG